MKAQKVLVTVYSTYAVMKPWVNRPIGSSEQVNFNSAHDAIAFIQGCGLSGLVSAPNGQIMFENGVITIATGIFSKGDNNEL